MMVRLPKDSQHVPQQSTADTKKQVRRIEKRHAWSGSRYPQGGAVTLYAVWGGQWLSVRFRTRRRANSEQQNNGLYFHGIEQLNLLCEFTIVQKRVFSQYNQHVH